MYKKILALATALVVMFAFTGCMSSNNEITVNADGTADVYVDMSIDKAKTYDVMYELVKEDVDDSLSQAQQEQKVSEYANEMLAEFEAGLLEDDVFKLEKINGRECWTVKENEQGISLKDARDAFGEYDSNTWISAKGFKIDMSEILDGVAEVEDDEELSNIGMTLVFKITLPHEIVKTNGELSADKKTVEWNWESIKKNSKIYAYAADKTKPVVKGVKNGKSYKGKVTVKVSDKDSGIKSAVIKNTKTGKTYAKFTSSKKVTKKGKYSVTVTDNMGNKRVVKFTVK